MQSQIPPAAGNPEQQPANNPLPPESSLFERVEIAVIGAGPAGLMAAERLSAKGHQVVVFDVMATPGRKFLMAGRGGLNLTHSEPPSTFAKRYGPEEARFRRLLTSFSAGDMRRWADDLGADTFIGSSGRIFPRAMKSSGLLRAWLARLAGQKVALRLRHRWLGWQEDDLVFRSETGAATRIRAKTTILALGGGSWPKLGSDGAWQDLLCAKAILVNKLVSSNCG
ncbi:MAG TPA: NAD(P)/FAD-dependent oxidoreductase, partial [Dongiaceae bacterium]